MRKILIVVTPISMKGGTIRRLKLWARYLSEHFRIRIMFFSSDSAVRDMFEREGVEVSCVKGLRRSGRVLIVPGAISIYRELVDFSPDLVLSMFLWSDFLTVIALRIARLFSGVRVPHIIHMAGDPVPPVRFEILKKLYGILLHIYLKHADKIITICRHEAELIHSRGLVDKEKVDVVRIGIELPESEVKNDIRNPFVFGVVSRLSFEKRVDIIIRAFREVLNKSSRPLKLVIYGDGICRGPLESLANKLDLRGNVEFAGWTDRPEDAFGLIDCNLIYSETEGTPRAIIESAAMGVLSIARNIGGVAEIIHNGETGYLVESEAQLRQKMLSLVELDDKEILLMGMAARKYVENVHLIDKEIDGIREIIGSIL